MPPTLMSPGFWTKALDVLVWPVIAVVVSLVMLVAFGLWAILLLIAGILFIAAIILMIGAAGSGVIWYFIRDPAAPPAILKMLVWGGCCWVAFVLLAFVHGAVISGGFHLMTTRRGDARFDQ
jgi:hypothetical protein